MTQTRYDNYGSQGSTDGSADYDSVQMKTPTTFTEIEFSLGHTAGVQSDYGQSLMTVFTDVEVFDGALYADIEKDNFKLFSWKSLTGFHPEEWVFDREDPLAASDADEIVSKDYNVAQKTYELAAARVPAVVDEDGEEVQAATTIHRPWEIEDGQIVFDGEFDSEGNGPVEAGDFIIFWSAGDNGAPVKSTATAETLTKYGDDAIVDGDDAFNWLVDTSGDNISRPDLDDRRLRLAMTEQQSDETEFTYNLPIYLDAETGARLSSYNRDAGGTDDDSEEAESALAEAKEADSGEYPEPIADFIRSGNNLNLNEDRATNLLDELLSDETNPLTEDMIDDVGGRDALINKVV